MFFWILPRKRACALLLEWMLEKTCDIGYKYNPTEWKIVWYWFPLLSLLIVTCHGFKREMHQRTSCEIPAAPCCFCRLTELIGRAWKFLLVRTAVAVWIKLPKLTCVN